MAITKKEALEGMEELVLIDKIHPNPWNPNVQTDFMYEKEKASIKKYGFVLPVIVRNQGKEFQIIDGEHRWQAVHELQQAGVQIFTSPSKLTPLPFGYINVKNLGTVTDEDAKQLTILMNELKGEHDVLKKAELLKELSETVPFEDLLEVLPYEPDELKNLIELTEFNMNQFKEVEKEPDEEGWVTVKFRMSQEQANVVKHAIERLVREVPIDGKNVEARALEYIAADSLGTPIASYQ